MGIIELWYAMHSLTRTRVEVIQPDLVESAWLIKLLWENGLFLLSKKLALCISNYLCFFSANQTEGGESPQAA